MTKKNFPADQTFGQLYRAVSARRYKEAEEPVRKLRKISGELGFAKMSALCTDILNAILIKCYKGIPSLFSELEEEYEEQLRKIQGD
ncbi:hypothetical protein [Hespellia stercorisuis]|uniref:Uncharacterized protein n=1 Tax=Hespellia stercorisuis DSM 15480 TaxID=1121950 RepID=A0A1M6URP1_9FIRM|nr:hypothetical protein [Hespellia stercorisuis]SHK71875.1 hypothetical protein SAMN02745243_03584 [Hespellia stercorisuis DSM 15480]